MCANMNKNHYKKKAMVFHSRDYSKPIVDYTLR